MPDSILNMVDLNVFIDLAAAVDGSTVKGQGVRCFKMHRGQMRPRSEPIRVRVRVRVRVRIHSGQMRPRSEPEHEHEPKPTRT